MDTFHLPVALAALEVHPSSRAMDCRRNLKLNFHMNIVLYYSITNMKVFEATSINKAIDTLGASNVVLVNKKAKSKVYTTGGGSTFYLNLSFKLGVHTSGAILHFEANPTSDVTTNIDPIEITADMPDSTNEVIKEKFKDRRDGVPLRIETTVGRSSVLGKIVNAVNDEYMRQMELKNDSTNPDERIELTSIVKVKGVDMLNVVRTLHSMIQKQYGTTEQTPEDLRGKDIADPKLRFNVSFDLYPKTYFVKSMAGQPKTVIRDYKKCSTVAGKKVYELAKIAVGTDPSGNTLYEDICKENVHKFITRGSKIYAGTFGMSSIAVTRDRVSVHMEAMDLTILSEETVDMQFIGDDGIIVGCGNKMTVPTSNTETTTIVTSDVETTTETTPVPAPLPADDITDKDRLVNELLAGL